MDKKTLIRYAKIIMLTPFILVWDIFYYSCKKIFEVLTVADEKGGELIDQFINKE